MPGQILAGDWIRHTAVLPRLALSTVDQKAIKNDDTEHFIEGFNQSDLTGA
jgi:hypothetical protein